MKFRRIGLLLLAFFAVLAPVRAEPQNETVQALAQAVLPVRDRIDLARRLLGVTHIAPPPTRPPQWNLGDTQSYWLTNADQDRAFQVEASLRTVGQHILLWVEDGVEIDPATLDGLAAIFDRQIYEPMHRLWGSENSPGIDGDPRVYGLFAYGAGPGVAAYYASDHIYPVEAVARSNEHEMLNFNLDVLGTSFEPEAIAGVVAHEFQHMIQEHLDTNESIWLNEGFSKFSEVYVGYPFGTVGTALTFLGQPWTQLDDWPEEGSTIQNYGASLMFVTYFYDRYGLDGLHALGSHPANGLEGVNAVLADLGQPDVNYFFADWVLANELQDSHLADGRYGYRSLSGLSGPAMTAVVGEYPFRWSGSVNQYAADYYAFNHTGGASSMDITLGAPDTVPLVPTSASSGSHLWYSHKADNSDTTLTRAFDLTGIDHATLNYKVWYYIEHLWDYGYVMVSTDDGATWTPLATPDMTTEDPHGNAYGPGYTGQSAGWLDQQIALDAYAGQKILLRFEMITDDATTQPGMVIDDVSLPEVGYRSDFESDSGGWQAQGWVWTDNVLPQQVWVQAVQQKAGADAVITRWLAPAEARWSLPLEPGVEQVTLAISPFAPVTTSAMPYTLDVSLQE